MKTEILFLYKIEYKGLAHITYMQIERNSRYIIDKLSLRLVAVVSIFGYGSYQIEPIS